MSAPLRLSGWRLVETVAATVIIAAYYFARFRDSVLTFFALDDFWILNQAARITPHSLTDLGQFLRMNHTGFMLYRPLTQADYFYLLHVLFGYDASGYHAVHLCIHIANALLVFAIVRHLTESARAGLAAGLIYAAAPGHITAVYWLAACSMSGTALIVLSMLYLWLRTASRWRAVGCAVLQVLGLLASEHAVVAPVLLALVSVFRPRREARRVIWRHLAAPSVAVGVYLVLKIYYFAYVRAFAPGEAYRPGSDGAGWLVRLGRYAIASLNATALLPLGERAWTGVGALLIAVILFAVWRALRGEERWRLLALGGSLFVTALMPVLPLRDHYYDYYIGIAAAGAAIAIVGGCALVTPRWRDLSLALAGGIVLLEMVTGGRAARSAPGYRFYLSVAGASAQWVATVQRVGADQTQVAEVFVPRDPLTQVLFEVGQAQRLFATHPPRVALYDPAQAPMPAPSRLVLQGPLPPVAHNGQLPGWQPQWGWLRRAAGCRDCAAPK